jgi:DNA topoisomerase 2-associated protein PAT1
MSFFGFDSTLPERRLDDKAGAEDVAVYTWGTDDYDGLGDQLQEQGDDSNDLTFGGGDIGESCVMLVLSSLCCAWKA